MRGKGGFRRLEGLTCVNLGKWAMGYQALINEALRRIAREEMRGTG